MSRARFLAAAMMLAWAGTAMADPEPFHLYFGNSPTDRTASNPVVEASGGQTVTLHLFAGFDRGIDINQLAVFLDTTNPAVANSGERILFNPVVTTPAGAYTRWEQAFTEPAVNGQAQLPYPGLDWTIQTGDLTYDPYTNSAHVASFDFVVNNLPGQVKPIFIVPFIGGSNPAGTIQLGIGDAPVAPGMGSAFADAYIQVIDPAETRLQGDYNDNGVVDAADYVVWRKSSGSTDTLPNDTTPGIVDVTDYDVWRSNFGNTAPAPAPAPGGSLGGAAAPAIQVVDQGLTADGNHKYLIQVAADEDSPLAVELGFSGAIVDVRARDARINSESDADTNDGLDGYGKEEDTFYFDGPWEFINRGDNPFTGTITSGFEADYAAGELFVALGSGTEHGLVTDLLQIVVEPGSEGRFTGLIAQNGESFRVSGVLQVPEPGAAAVLVLLAAGLLRRSTAR